MVHSPRTWLTGKQSTFTSRVPGVAATKNISQDVSVLRRSCLYLAIPVRQHATQRSASSGNMMAPRKTSTGTRVMTRAGRNEQQGASRSERGLRWKEIAHDCIGFVP
jgi:hypothetical protein